MNIEGIQTPHPAEQPQEKPQLETVREGIDQKENPVKDYLNEITSLTESIRIVVDQLNETPSDPYDLSDAYDQALFKELLMDINKKFMDGPTHLKSYEERYPEENYPNAYAGDARSQVERINQLVQNIKNTMRPVNLNNFKENEETLRSVLADLESIQAITHGEDAEMMAA